MTQMIEQAAVQFLKNSASVSSLVGTNVFSIRMPSKFKAWPCIVMRKISGKRDGTHSGAAFKYPRLQASCYSTSYAEAKRVAKAVADLFDQFAGTMGNFTRVTADVANELDLHDDETKLYHTNVDVILMHVEAAS